MSEFIKKNMPLVVVLGATALIALVLIFMVVMQYQTINEKMLSIDTINSQINAITAQTNPRVVKENAVRIKEDAAALEQKTKEQQRVFGCFLDSAVNVFIETLRKEAVSDDFKKVAGEMTLKSLHDILADKVQDMGKDFKPENPGQDDLKKLYAAIEDEILASANEQDKAAYKKAFAAFLAEAGKVTLEDLSNEKDEYSAQIAVFLQALGLPRSFENALKFAPYFSKYALGLVAGKEIPFANMEMDNNETRITTFFTGRRGFSGDDEDAGEAALNKISNKNIPYIMTRIQIYENLIQNMKDSGVKLVSLYRKGSYLPDAEDNGYSTFSTEVEVRGSLPQIRDFANRLHQEYKNNRVYLVTYLNLSCDNAAELKDSKSEHSKEIANTMSYVKLLTSTTADGSNSEEQAMQAQKNKDIINDNWGAALIGVNDEVYAVFHINYIVFTGDQITNAKK